MNTLPVLLFALVACAPAPEIYRAPVRQQSYYSVNADGSASTRYSRIDEWSAYSTLGAQASIAAAYEQAQHAPPPVNHVDIYNASLPPGVTLEHGALKIDKDAPFDAIGRFEIGYQRSSAPLENEIEPDLHRLAQVAQGDTIVVEVQRLDRADDHVDSMVGLVLRKRDAAARTGSAPTPRQREHARAHLVYTASGAGCPSADEFADEVSAKLGYSPWQVNGPVLRADIQRGNDAYHAKLSFPTSAPRSLTGASCRAVINAAIIAVTVELDDRVTTATASAKPHLD
jgi:hypothetical protein